MNNFKKLCFFLLPLIFLSFYKDEAGHLNTEKIIELHSAYMDYIHPQKPYIITDKDSYHAPDRIWVRAFLFDGRTHLPDTVSDHVYVELVDPYQRIAQVIRIKTNEFDGAGDFMLTDSVPEGAYQIRAYTNWMKNFGEEYYFVKNLLVSNPTHEYLITDREARKNRKANKKLKKQTGTAQVGIFPEGGNLLEEVNCRVALKAEDLFGKGLRWEGKLIDKNDHVLTTFKSQHNGMGSFNFVPEEAMDYAALITFENGNTEKVKLPVALTNAVGLSATSDEDNHYLTIKSNKLRSADRPANEFVLTGQVRGKIYHTSVHNLLDNDTLVTIRKSDFPQGIVQFTLINNRLQPVSSRLVFHHDTDFIGFEIDGQSTADSLFLTLNPINLGNNAVFDGAITVMYADSFQTENTGNIISELLITSDLPGYIFEPSYYLKLENKEVRHHADLLMLTHGWKRYAWQNILAGNLPDLDFEPEDGITVEGKITREVFEFPLKNASVRLYVQDRYNDEFEMVTGQKGNFRFDKLNYEDTIDVKIIARRESGGKNLLIHLNQPDFDDVSEISPENILTAESKLNKRAYRHLMNDLAREERNRRERELDSIFNLNIHGRPDFVLWGYELPSGYSNLRDAMQGRIPGVNMIGNRIIIRGVGSINGNSEPLVLVDNVPADVSILYSIPPTEVERVEVLKGPSASMYGSRGGNGVIAVYTKRGSFMKKGEISFSMLGYHIEETFYSPSEEMISSRVNLEELPITVYWNPELKLGNHSAQVIIPVVRTEKRKIILIEGTDNSGKLGYGYFMLK